MVRRSSLVYELLKSERRDDGFTPKEIIDRVSRAYDISAGKGLRKQVAVALRRGIDFGIIARKNNKYRFDPGSSAVIEAWAPRRTNVAATNASTRNTNNTRKKKKPRRKPRTSAAGQSRSGKQQQKRTKPSTRKEPLPPRPKVPRPPNWNPKRRNLSEEPIPKVIKHPSNDPTS